MVYKSKFYGYGLYRGVQKTDERENKINKGPME